MVVANAARCEVSFVAFGRSGQVSEARLESTFLADDAACLTLVRAVIQLRCFGIVSLGCGLLSCVVCGVSSMESGFRQSSIPLVSSHRSSPSLAARVESIEREGLHHSCIRGENDILSNSGALSPLCVPGLSRV